jgi:hypothetical protein
MSNTIYFEPTKFEDVRSGNCTYGCRIFDNYAQTYINDWDNVSDDDLEVIAKCIEQLAEMDNINCTAFTGNTFDAMMAYLVEYEQGVFVGDIWYEWDKIKHLFNRYL